MQGEIARADYKYRICKSSNGRHVIFGCDYDSFMEPSTHFFGCPIYIESAPTAGLSLGSTTIGGIDYVGVTHLKPESTYLSSIALKLLCKSLNPDLVIDTTTSPARTQCLVPSSSVVRTIYSLNNPTNTINAGLFHERLELIKSVFDEHQIQSGIIGSQLFSNSMVNDLDIVLIGAEVSHLQLAWTSIRSLLFDNSNSYIHELWPLTIRGTDGSSIDFFFNPIHVPDYYAHLYESTILNRSFEFHETINDNSNSFLSIPRWGTESSIEIVSMDNTLRGRFKKGTTVIGKGVLRRHGKHTYLQVETSDNMHKL